MTRRIETALDCLLAVGIGLALAQLIVWELCQ